MIARGPLTSGFNHAICTFSKLIKAVTHGFDSSKFNAQARSSSFYIIGTKPGTKVYTHTHHCTLNITMSSQQKPNTPNISTQSFQAGLSTFSKQDARPFTHRLIHTPLSQRAIETWKHNIFTPSCIDSRFTSASTPSRGGLDPPSSGSCNTFASRGRCLQ